MLVGPTLDEVRESLNAYFANDSAPRAKLVGIVFCRPESSFMAEMLPSMHHYHFASGAHCNFYFAGYYEGPESQNDDLTVSPGRGRPDWAFNYDSFNLFAQQLEQQVEWEYSGGADLILINGVPGKRGRGAELDYDSALPMNLDEMKQMGAITNCDLFFQSIFRYAQNADANDPTWGYSDYMGQKIGRSVLWGLVLAILPEPVRARVIRAVPFARQGRRKLKVRR